MNHPQTDPDPREREMFMAALDQPTPGARSAFLDGACRGDAPLRARVEAMLADHFSSDSFMAAPVPGEAPTVLTDLPITERPGDRIGRYKLLEKIGEGGCGVVYMAEQEEPVRRKVALKIIKPGMDSKSVIARFEAERQALALMDHPNIAKVFDGGVTGGEEAPSSKVKAQMAGGRPYFVMELVRGIRITDYCDQHRLSTRERLDLFILVCQAVQHAHQKGIIHRDLKPSNILVSENDGKPVPKVIDFGIAKATEQKLTDKTLFTQFAQFLGTPAYMSPEQAAMTTLDVDTRSDIYSLGVLLYELLTGSTPFDGQELVKAGFDEMRRIIRETEPDKPSTRLTQSLVAADVRRRTSTQSDESASSPRRLPTKDLIHQMRGDLDWIVMKCLEKERSRRYETANGLAADIQRHLGNEPVIARPPSATYRFQKMVRRNRPAVASIASVFLALAAGVALSTWQAVRATRAEALAKQRLTESEAISKFLTGVFQSPDPSRDGRSITVAETLDKAAKWIETDLTAQPDRRAKLQLTLGNTYFALGLFRDAIPLHEKARDHYRAASGPEHPDTVLAMDKLAYSYGGAGRWQEELKLREELLPLSRKVLGSEHPRTIVAMAGLWGAYRAAGRWAEALELQKDVLLLSRKVNGPEHPHTLIAMNNLAISYAAAALSGEALKLREELLALSRKVLGREHPDTLLAMSGLANSYHNIRRDDALKLREELLPVSRKVNGPEHPQTLGVMHNLALSYTAAGRREEGLKLIEEVLSLSRKSLGPEHPDTLLVMHSLGGAYRDAGRMDEAIKLQEEALSLRRKASGPEHPHTRLAMQDLAISYDAVGRRDEALKLGEDVLTIHRKLLGRDHPDTLAAMMGLAGSYRKAGRADEAIKLGESSLDAFRRVSGITNANTLNAMTELAISYQVARRTGEAIMLEEESLLLKRQHLPPGDSLTVESMENLATGYEESDRKPEADALRRELAELKARAENQKQGDGRSTVAPVRQ